MDTPLLRTQFWAHRHTAKKWYLEIGPVSLRSPGHSATAQGLLQQVYRKGRSWSQDFKCDVDLHISIRRLSLQQLLGES